MDAMDAPVDRTPPHSLHARFNETAYAFVELVAPIEPGGEAIVLCADKNGRHWYAPVALWDAVEPPASPTADPAARPVPPAPAALPPSVPPSVTRRSAPEAKVALFRSLFRGRDDVYAKGYRDRRPDAKPNAISYAPACLNEWTPVCRNLHHKCRACRHRANAPLTDDAIAAHLRGTSADFKGAVGLYVVQPDDTVFLLATDFDGRGWRQAVAAYRATCRDAGLDVAVERSRSGDGAHAWLFFENPVEARVARAMGTRLLTDAMRRSDALSFSSYDRMFPAQDRLVAEGFGSLIALPLQGWARANGNAVFVDENLVPFEDQWAYLASLRRVTDEQVARHARGARTALGRLAQLDAMAQPDETDGHAEHADGVAPSASTQAAAPASEAAAHRRAAPAPLSPADFPTELHVVWRDLLLIPKQGLSPAAIGALRRLAAFANPEFYLAQNMRRSVRGIPRVLFVGEETFGWETPGGETPDRVESEGETAGEADRSCEAALPAGPAGHIGLPRGCIDTLRDLLDRSGVPYVIDDRRTDGRPIDVAFLGTLRPEQEPAVRALLDHETGVLSAPTGFGKTVVGAALIGDVKVSTLVLVPRTALLDQWRDELERFLLIDEEPPVRLTKTGRISRKRRRAVGCLGGGRNELTGIIDIVDYQSLFEKGELAGERRLRSFVDGYGLVLCDECHHGAAPLLGEALAHIPARRVYGLSATPRRTDGLEGIVYLHCGPARYAYAAKEQARAQGMARIMVPRFLGTRLAETVNGGDVVQVQEALAADAARNAAVVGDACDLVRRGRTPLVLTRLTGHARTLAADLERRGVAVHLLLGSDSNPTKREKLARLRDQPPDQAFAVVATGGYAGEGFDCPRLDTLLLAAPVKSETLVTQFTGRLHRTGPDKADVQVFDYVDAHVTLLDRMYRARLKTYARLGYEVYAAAPGKAGGVGGTNGADGCQALVSGDAWLELLLADIGRAQCSVHIEATWASKRTVAEVARTLEQARERGVAVDVSVREPCDAAKQARLRATCACLDEAGCPARFSATAGGDWAVIDGGLVWYGGVSPLGGAHQRDEFSLRFRNPAVAQELLGRRAASAPDDTVGCQQFKRLGGVH